jgi:type VI secretion system protein ImpM
MSRPVAVPLLFFGKLPSRGDFVRSPHTPLLIQTLDRWLMGGVEALATDPRWKLLYDKASPVDFAFLGSRSARGMVGHMIASGDLSGRRFPFITAGVLEVENPGTYLSRSPLAMASAWRSLQGSARRAHEATDSAELLAEMGQATVEVDGSAQGHDADFLGFLEQQSVGMLENILTQAGHDLSLRTMLLGLGLLLHPVPASGVQRLDKGLSLPLPADPLYQSLVATFWLDLVAHFLTRADFELALFVQCAHDRTFSLHLGFDGASPRALRALMDPDYLGEVFVDARKADWVEEFVEQDYAVKKLSSYLQQPGLSLRQARDTFTEAFLGS